MTEPNDQQDTSVVELDPILEAESKHGPIFRRELFDTAYDAWQASGKADPQDRNILPNGHPSGTLRAKVTLRDIYGVKHEKCVYADGDEHEFDGQKLVSKRCWIYKCLQRLGHSYNKSSQLPSKYQSDIDLCPFELGGRFVAPVKKNCFDEEDLKPKAQAWTSEWQNSEICHKLSAFLQEHAGTTMQHVDKIICFGLGCFPSKHERAQKRAYTQHLAALTIRSILATQQGGPAPPVFTQEPIYCAAGITHIVSPSPFNFTVLDDPEGFRALDGNTFILSVAPNVPVRQIVLGMTHTFGGPAGMFCDEIQSEGLECNGKGSEIDGNQRRFTPYKTCEPSPALWKYKQEGVWMECGDWEGEACFGRMGCYLKKREG